MSRLIRHIAIATTTLAVAGCSTMGGMGGSGEATSPAQEQAALAGRAQAVLQQQMSKPAAKRIPAQLVANARCVAVFPSVIQAGFIIGGKRGQGLVTCRQAAGGFANAQPAAFTLSAGSLGLQAGAQKSSVVLLFNTKQSVDSLFQPEIKFGSQIQATAGPSGYDKAITRAPAPVVAYVTSAKGLFAGINLNGSKLTFNQSANAAVYGPQTTARGILLGNVNKASAMAAYIDTLTQFAPGGGADHSNGASGSQSNSGQQSNSQQSSGSDQQSQSGQHSQMSGSGQSQSGSSNQSQQSGSMQQPQSNSDGQSQQSGSMQQPQSGSGQKSQ